MKSDGLQPILSSSELEECFYRDSLELVRAALMIWKRGIWKIPGYDLDMDI